MNTVEINADPLQILLLAGLILLVGIGGGILAARWIVLQVLLEDRDVLWHRFILNIAEFKQVKAALGQSETFNRAILYALPDLIIRMHRDGTYLDVKLTDTFPMLTTHQAVGKNVCEVLPEDLAQSRLAAAAVALQTGKIQVYEFPFCIQGQYFWQEARVVPLNSDQVLIVVRDLTQRKQMEEALRQSEARLAMAQRVAQVGNWEWDLESQTRTWSEVTFHHWGLDPTQREPSFAELLQMVHPDDRAICQQTVETAIQTGISYTLDLRVMESDGSIRYLDSRGEPMLNAQGQVVKLIGTSLDITERKQAEVALRESETRFRQLAETVREGFFVFETESAHYSYVNPAYATIMGIPYQSSYQEMSHWLNNIHPDDRDRIAAGLRQEGQGENFNEEYRFIRPDSEIRWLQSQAFPLKDETGTIVRIVGIVEDISARKQLEQSLRSQAEEERLLATITQKIRRSLDLEQILATTVNEVQQTFNADRALIFRLNSDGSGQVIQETVLPEYPITRQMLWQDECFLDECYAYYQQGNPRIVPDVATDTWAACLAEFMQEAGVKSKVVAPIVQIRGETAAKVWGLLVVHACSHYRQWQDLEADFLQRICNQLAIAIDQSNLYQQLQTELAERKQTEDALRQSEARLAMAQQVAQVGYWEFDFATQKRTWSEITFPQWGLDSTQPEPSLNELFEMVHPDDRAALQESREKTIKEGIPYALDLRVVHPDGSIRYLDSRAEPVYDAQGQLVKLIGTSVDVTERKQTEKALQEREAMLRAIGDNLPKGFIYQRVYEPGKGFYYSYISAGVERLLGIKPEAVLENPQTIRSVGFAEELAYADKIAQESLKNLTPVELQMRNKTATGNIQWSSIRSVPRRLDDGRTVWDGVEVDITELKRIEAALRASEELFRGAFDNAPIGISLVSTTGQFVKVNPYYCELLEYTEAELLTLTFQEITHPDDLELDLGGFQQMMAGEIRSFQLEKRYITKQGTFIPVLINAALVRDQNRQPLYCVGQVQDIRDRLKVERMKDEFISVVSHELRTPLTSIRGALGILGSGVFDDRPERAKHMLQIAIANSDRLVRLVDDILSLERLGSGRVQLVMEQCQVADLMQQAVESVQAIADQAGIALSLASLNVSLWVAPDVIIQALTNLLSNAIKFSSPGNTVWLKAELGNGEWELRNGRNGKTLSDIPPSILFTVKDQGRGIPEDKLDIIFEQFQQVDVSDSRKKGGTGLGLAICKNIVQQHGGRIWAESSLGKGSTFYFTLPLTQKDERN